MAPFGRLVNYLPTGLVEKARSAYNTVAGDGFNQRAFEAAHREKCKFEEQDVEDGEVGDEDEEEWTDIVKRPSSVSGNEEDNDQELPANIYPGRPRRLSICLSEKAAEKAAQAAGVSREYLGTALKLVALEMCRDVGWLMSCKTATDAVRAVKKRFPVLEDMERAYKEGGLNAKPLSKSSSGEEDQEAPMTTSTGTGVCPMASPASVPTSGQDQRNITKHQVVPIYDPKVHAGIEIAPTGDSLYSDHEDLEEEEEQGCGIEGLEGFSTSL